MSGRNVLRVNAVEEQARYRDAVADILRNVQNDEKITLAEIADTVDVSLGTISNAANKKADLNPIYLKRLGEAFGPHHLDPYARLCGGRVTSIEHDQSGDVLPFLTMASHRIAMARCPTSPGGVREIPAERFGYLADLRRLQRELAALVCSIEAERDAA